MPKLHSDFNLTAEFVVAFRQKLDLSQAEFSQKFGIGLEALQNYEQGRRSVTGISALWIMTIHDSPDRAETITAILRDAPGLQR